MDRNRPFGFGFNTNPVSGRKLCEQKRGFLGKRGVLSVFRIAAEGFGDVAGANVGGWKMYGADYLFGQRGDGLRL